MKVEAGGLAFKDIFSYKCVGGHETLFQMKRKRGGKGEEEWAIGLKGRGEDGEGEEEQEEEGEGKGGGEIRGRRK